MSTTTAETENSPESDENNPDGTGTPEVPTNPAESTTDPDSTTFTREYVEELRQENARHRQNAKKSDELTRRLVASLASTSGRLHDVRDLAYSEELLDHDGYPDPEKINAAVEALIQSRPHLAKIRPVGNVGQGQHEEAPNDLAAFGSFLRS